MYQVEAGRVISKDGKELFCITREMKNDRYLMNPCETDAMAHFIVDALNNGNFEEFYKEYMAS